MTLIRDSRFKTKHSITFIHTCAGNSDTFSDKHKYKITIQTHYKIIKQIRLYNFFDKNKLDYLFINNLVLHYEKSDFNNLVHIDFFLFHQIKHTSTKPKPSDLHKFLKQTDFSNQTFIIICHIDSSTNYEYVGLGYSQGYICLNPV